MGLNLFQIATDDPTRGMFVYTDWSIGLHMFFQEKYKEEKIEIE